MRLKYETITNAIASVFAISLIIAAEPQKAEAATLHDGWNYAIDSFNDGVTGGQVGGGEFEFYG